jgi:hypothetical protein
MITWSVIKISSGPMKFGASAGPKRIFVKLVPEKYIHLGYDLA